MKNSGTKVLYFAFIILRFNFSSIALFARRRLPCSSPRDVLYRDSADPRNQILRLRVQRLKPSFFTLYWPFSCFTSSSESANRLTFRAPAQVRAPAR